MSGPVVWWEALRLTASGAANLASASEARCPVVFILMTMPFRDANRQGDSEMEIILAEDSHVPAIQQIYAHHVLQGTGSFEIVPPDEAEIASRLEKLRAAGLPWFVALSEGQVCGYCYLSFYRPRYAYRFTLEDSLYIAPAFQGKGIGKRLLAHAIHWAESRGFRQMVGNVGDSANVASIALHRAAGFTVTGTLTSVGFKHGRWLDTVLMQPTLGDGDSTLPEN